MRTFIEKLATFPVIFRETPHKRRSLSNCERGADFMTYDGRENEY